jgi:dCTP deaminase
VPFILEHGQVVGRLVYERLTARPDKLYGDDLGSNYQAQGLKLSKHFRPVTPMSARGIVEQPKA